MVDGNKLNFKDFNFIDIPLYNKFSHIINNVGIIIYESQLKKIGNSKYILRTEDFVLCPENPSYLLKQNNIFYNSPQLATLNKNQSCIIISYESEIIALTASHFINQNNLLDYRIIFFDFIVAYPSQKQFVVSEQNVYLISSVREVKNHYLLKLENDFNKNNFYPIKLNQRDSLPKNSIIFSLGYPFGTPLKITKGKILKSQKHFVLANLHAFDGSSGSPCFYFKDDETLFLGTVSESIRDDGRVGGRRSNGSHAKIDECNMYYIGPTKIIRFP